MQLIFNFQEIKLMKLWTVNKMKYAKTTKVSIENSQIAIQKLLRKYGATRYAIDWDKNNILFELHGRPVRIHVKDPDINDKEIQFTPSGIQRSPANIQTAFKQAQKQMWRVMLLFLKATLEAIDSGVIELDQAMFPYFLLPNGRTISEQLLPQLANNVSILSLPQFKGDE